MSYLRFEKSFSNGYKERTILNAASDATIAIAIDFDTSGEKLTKASVLKQNKKYIPIKIDNLNIDRNIIDYIIDELNDVNAKTLNIAGNGIYTFKNIFSQNQLDDYVYDLIKSVISSPNLKNDIILIRSGGQTGIDESGAKAGCKLKIKTIVLAPNGWKFRDICGNDISNERLFKNRFNID